MPDAERWTHHDRREARELVVAVDRPLARAAVVLDQCRVALERGGVEAIEVQLVDADDVVGLRERGVDVAPLVDAAPALVAADLVVQDRRAGIGRGACVDDRAELLVLDLDELGGVARELARRRDDRGDRIADEPCLADREGVVLEIAAWRGRDLEEGLGQDRDLVARERSDDTRRLEGRGHVDRDDPGVRVRRAHEVHEAHVVALHVVDEHALTLDEPAILLTRDARADDPADRGGVGGDGAHARVPAFAALCTASTMFQ